MLADEHWVDGLGSIDWPLADHEGTIEQVARYDGGAGTTSVDRRIRYDTFGQVLDVLDGQGTSLGAGAIDSRFAFTGRQWDADTELYYYRARWCDPAVGRFLSEDPSGFDGGDPNLYRYAGNDPVNQTDPSGLRVARPTDRVAVPLGFTGDAGVSSFTPELARTDHIEARLIDGRFKSFQQPVIVPPAAMDFLPGVDTSRHRDQYKTQTFARQDGLFGQPCWGSYRGPRGWLPGARRAKCLPQGRLG